jgi:hypothetical protein
MSGVRSTFKALTPDQRALVEDRRVAGKRSPDEWLRLLGPVAEFDRQADAVRQGGGGFWDRRFARKHDVANGLRSFTLPLLPILREDQDPALPLELSLDFTGAEQKSKETGTSEPYRKGAYHKVVDTFYDDPWIAGRARFVDGADVRFTVIDHVRSSRKTKRSASGKTKRKTKGKKKIEVAVIVSLPTRNYAAGGEPATERSVRKESIETSADRTVVRLSRVVQRPLDHPPEVELLLELLAGAYERVDPSRRKKL